MPPSSDVPISETLPPTAPVHVLGAGPVGLAVAALLQSNDRFSVHLYEKRAAYTRTRMVHLSPYLVADSLASYCADYIDGESVEAIFEPSELAEGLAFRQSLPSDLMGLLRDGAWGSARSTTSSARSATSSMRVRRTRCSARWAPSRRRTP